MDICALLYRHLNINHFWVTQYSILYVHINIIPHLNTRLIKFNVTNQFLAETLIESITNGWESSIKINNIYLWKLIKMLFLFTVTLYASIYNNFAFFSGGCFMVESYIYVALVYGMTIDRYTWFIYWGSFINSLIDFI